jgi:cell division septation protein DedD
MTRLYEGGAPNRMDWLRRNWPDVAIGVALLAVIAGIIATLLTGGSFFPVASSPSNPAIATPRTGVTPSLPGATSTLPGTAGSPVTALPPGGAQAEAPTGEAAGVIAVTVTPPSAEGAAPIVTPVSPAPAATAPAATTPATASPASTQPAAPQAAAASPAATPAATATVAVAPPSPAVMPTVSTNPEAPYRVAVGAFGSVENAQRQAETFRAAGYPVFTGQQGALTIVLVGPYESEAAAEQVAARIRAGTFGIDPVIYRFRPDAPTAAASTPSPAVPAPAATAPAAASPVVPAGPAPAAAPTPAPAPVAAAPAPAAASTPVPVTATGRLLQVGAFGSAESAAPLRQRLASLGYVASERAEDGLIKLLVGPFDDSSLQRARSHLAGQGIESFPR